MYQFSNVGIGSVTVPHGNFSTNGNSIPSMSSFQFSNIDINGQDLTSVLSTFDHNNGDGYKVTAYGDCGSTTTTTSSTSSTTTTTTTPDPKQYAYNWSVTGTGSNNTFRSAVLKIQVNGVNTVTAAISPTNTSDGGVIMTALNDVIDVTLITENQTGSTIYIEHELVSSISSFDLLDTDFTASATDFTTVFQSYTQQGTANSTWVFTTDSSTVAPASLTIDFEDSGDTSQFSTLSGGPNGAFSEEYESTTTSNGTYNFNLVVGDSYTLDSAYESINPGENCTLTVSGSQVGGFTSFSDSDSGQAQTIIGPVSGSFTVTGTGAIALNVTQTSP